MALPIVEALARILCLGSRREPSSSLRFSPWLPPIPIESANFARFHTLIHRRYSGAESRDWKSSVRRNTPKSILWKAVSARLAYASGGPEKNFGDELSPMLIRALFNISVKHSGMDAADLISTGSLLDWANTNVMGERPVVWGSGFIEAGPRYSGGELDVRAVRGRLSLDRLGIPSERRTPLGDPGLLTSIAFRRPKRGKGTVGLVPHFTDSAHPLVALARQMPGVEVIDVHDPVGTVIDKIASCGLILSSSLHGLVVAESYGVPNVWCPLGDGVIGGDYKFRDYYSAFGVDATSADLLETLSRVDQVRAGWTPLPDLARKQDDLLRAFPLPYRKR